MRDSQWRREQTIELLTDSGDDDDLAILEAMSWLKQGETLRAMGAVEESTVGTERTELPSVSAPPKVAAKTTEKKKKKKKKEKINATKGPFGGGDSEEEHEEEGDDQSTTNEASAVQWQSVLIRSLRRGLQAHLLLGSAGNGREVARKEGAAAAATTTASTSDTTARAENAMSVDLETSKVEPRDAQAARYRSATRAGALLLVDGEKEEQEGDEEAQPHDPASLHAPSFSSMSTSAPTPATRNMAGVAYAARGEFEAAQACFQDAFRLASSSVASKGWHALEPVYNLAALYWATGALQNISRSNRTDELVLCEALVRTYDEGQRRVHPAHYDGDALVTAVLELC